MAERCANGEFGGSPWLAAKAPTTAGMNINPASIDYQRQNFSPATRAARRADHARVEAETTAAKESDTSVKIVFCERRGASSAKTAAGKLEKS